MPNAEQKAQKSRRRSVFNQPKMWLFYTVFLIAMLAIPVREDIASSHKPSFSEIVRGIPNLLELSTYFPLGLGIILDPFSASYSHLLLIVGWFVYVALGVAVACVENRVAIFILMLVLIALLLTNIHGCEVMLNNIYSV